MTAEERNREREDEIRKDHADERTIGDHRAWREERGFLLAALDTAREALAAAERRLSVYRPIVEQAVAWHDWMGEELHALVEAMPDELYYEIVEDVEADNCRARAATEPRQEGAGTQG